MAGNPFINSITNQNQSSRFGRFGAGGQQSEPVNPYLSQYGQQPHASGPQYSSGPQPYAQDTGYQMPDQYMQAPGYPDTRTGSLSMNDVIMKTGLCLALVVLGAAVAWYIPLLLFVGLIGGLILGLVNSFKRKVSPALVLLYAVFEGMLLGGISSFMNTRYPGIAMQAVVATLVVFGVILALFANGKIRATPKLTKIFFVGLLSYLGLALVSLGLSAFGLYSTQGGTVAGMSIGLLIGVLGVALATYSLVLDFTNVSEAVEAGLPERESWRLAFGLTASLVWLYIEILRILWYVTSIFSNN